MKNRSTVTFFHLIFCCTCMVLAGCSSDDSGGGSDIPTIRFWHFWSEPSQKEALAAVILQYQQKYQVKVELTELSWNDGKAKLQAAFNSGNPPDVVELGSDWIAQFSSAGVLTQLSSNPTEVGRFINFSMAPGMWGNKAYAYPWIVDTRVLYVNNDLLKGAGWNSEIRTLDDLLNASKKVHEVGGFGYGANGADAHRLYKKVLPLMWTMGGSVFDAQGRPAINSPENVKAFTMMLDLARTGFIETQRQLDASFLQGKLAFWISGSWILDKLNANKKLDYSVLEIPGSDGKPGISFMGGEYLAVSAASKNQHRATQFVQFMTSGEQALSFCKKVSEAGFPADTSQYMNAELIRTPAKKVFAQQLKNAKMTPVHPRWLDIEEVIEDAAVRVLLGDKSPQDALNDAQHEVLEIVDAK
ncbi:MAG: extracellular solute-binding protein [Ignavibacteria bacterium]|nr:extracellular solute-binding protein [Ignavibacteria bacterium]